MLTRVLAAALIVTSATSPVARAAGPDLADLCTIFPVEAGIVYTYPNDVNVEARSAYCVAIYGQKYIEQHKAYSSTGSATVDARYEPANARTVMQRDVDASRRVASVRVERSSIGEEGWEISQFESLRLVWVRDRYLLRSSSADISGTGAFAGMTATAAQARTRAMQMDAALKQALAARTSPTPRATPTPVAIVDDRDRFEIQHIEVVQAIQTPYNDVPLVAGKRTIVRVFPRDSKDDDRISASARLRVIDQNGKATEIGRPENDKVTVQPRPDRVNHGHSLNFVLPEELTAVGVVTIQAELILPDDQKQDRPTAQTNVRFRKPPAWPEQYRIAYLAVCTPNDCPSQAIADMDGLLRRIFPVSDRSLSYFALPVPPVVWNRSLLAPHDRHTLKTFVRKLYDMIEASSPGTMDQLAAWLPGSAETFKVYGSSDGTWSTSRGHGHVTWQLERGRVESEHTLAHEIAHNLGLRHTARTNAEGARDDHCGSVDSETAWPYKDGTVQEVGYDASEGKVLNAARYDVMTYCSSRIWVSPYTFDRLFNAVPAPAPAIAPRPVAVVSGSLKKDGSAGALDSAYLFSSSGPAVAHDPRGDHCLRFTGTATTSVCFAPTFQDDQGQALTEESFSLVVEVPAGTKMSLTRGARELATLSQPPTPPLISLAGPAARTTLPPMQELTWTGPGSATYAVMYSPNDRKTWYPLSIDQKAAALTIDTTKLAAGDGIWLRVLGADGLATAVAESGPYTVEDPDAMRIPLVPLAMIAAGLAILLLVFRPRRAR